MAGIDQLGNTVGGINWPGASFDPETAIFYGQAGNSSITQSSYSPEELEIIGPEHQAKNRIPWWESPSGDPDGPGAAGRGGGRGEPGARRRTWGRPR